MARGFGRGRRWGEEPSDKSRKELLRSSLKLASYLAPHWKTAVGVLLLTIGVAGLNLVRPKIVRILLDSAIGHDDAHLLNLLCLSFLGVILFSALFQFLDSYLRHGIGQKIIKRLRTDLYDHLQDLSLTFYESHATGDIMSRLVNDAEAVEDFVVHTLEALLSSILILTGVTVILFLSNPLLAALTLVPIPLLVVCVVVFSRRFRGLFRDVRERTSDLNTFPAGAHRGCSHRQGLRLRG